MYSNYVVVNWFNYYIIYNVFIILITNFTKFIIYSNINLNIIVPVANIILIMIKSLVYKAFYFYFNII